MNLKTLTTLLAVTAISLGVTATQSQSSSATDTKNSDRCNSVHSRECNRNHRDVCNNDHPNNCDESSVEYCSDHPDNCNDRVDACQTKPAECKPEEPKAETPKPEEPKPSTQVTNRFFCSESDGVPTTFVETPKGTYPVIRWVSTYFSGHGYEPLTRCRQVSAKFQQFFNDGSLNYITTGTVNRSPVICVSNTMGGACTGVLFTLKQEEDANRVIQQLFDLRSGATGPLEESGSRLYFDMKKYLRTVAGV